MTLDQLRVFVAVAELEHVTRASYALGMMQSAVSKSVAALEGETGLRLFDRVGRNIRLTVTGAAFRDHARELLDHASRLEAWAAASRPAYPTTALVRVAIGRPHAEPIRAWREDRSPPVMNGSKRKRWHCVNERRS